MYHIVYLTTNLVNGKIYVGKQSTTDLEDGYLGSGDKLKLAFKKYGRNNFKRVVLHYCLTAIDAFEIESQIVDQWFVNRRDTYNVSLGGKGGNHSTQTRLKMSRNRTGKSRIACSEECKVKIGLKNSNPSDVTRKLKSDWQKGKDKPHLQTDEVKQKRIESLKGKNSCTRPVCIDGTEYKSIRQAKIATGYTYKRIMKIIQDF